MSNVIGKKISAARAQKGLSQVELAEAIGIKKAQLSRYEVGSSIPRPVTVKKIANALNVPYDALQSDRESTGNLASASTEELIDEILKRMPGHRVTIEKN